MAEKSNFVPHYEWFNELNNVMIYAIQVSAISSGSIPIEPNICSAVDELIPHIMEKCMNTDFERRAILFYYPDQETLYLRYIK